MFNIVNCLQVEYKLTSHFKCISSVSSGGRVAPTLNELAVMALQIGEHTENVDIVTKCIQLIEYIAAIDDTIMPHYFHVSTIHKWYLHIQYLINMLGIIIIVRLCSKKSKACHL